MDKWKGKIAVITGSSSGIGAGISKELVKQGLQVIGLARRVDRLMQLADELSNLPGKFHPFECDISDPVQVSKIFENINSKFGGVDILVNNAGCVASSTLIDGPHENNKKVFETNVLGLTQCTQETVKSMIERDAPGHVIHINSIYGHINPLAKHLPNTYVASKYAVTALSETLRQELLIRKHLKIKVTSLSPGFVNTEIIRDSKGDILDYFSDMALLEVEDIVNAIVFILGTPEHVQIQELTIRSVGEAF